MVTLQAARPPARLRERGPQRRSNRRDAIARAPVPRQTPQVRRRNRVQSADQPVLPVDQVARSAGRLERGHVPGTATVSRTAVDHHGRVIPALSEIVRHMRWDLALPGRPPQPERLRGDPRHGTVPVQPHHLVALQPRLRAHMPAIGRRPSAPRQVPLPLPGAEAARRLHIREPHHGRVRKRHPDRPPSPVVYPTSNPPGSAADPSPGEAESVLLITKMLNEQRHNPVQATRQVDLNTRHVSRHHHLDAASPRHWTRPRHPARGGHAGPDTRE